MSNSRPPTLAHRRGLALEPTKDLTTIISHQNIVMCSVTFKIIYALPHLILLQSFKVGNAIKRKKIRRT